MATLGTVWQLCLCKASIPYFPPFGYVETSLNNLEYRQAPIRERWNTSVLSPVFNAGSVNAYALQKYTVMNDNWFCSVWELRFLTKTRR